MTAYEGAQRHYLSPKRRDPVKIQLEEVVTHEVLAEAVERLNLAPGKPLRVLDFGSGTGDGVALLSESHGGLAPVTAGRELRYLGLDSDPGMVATAKEQHQDARFVVGDMRDPLPDEDFDLYLSCGVPYSHLTPEDASAVLATVFRNIRRRAVVIVDVLGRYSVEWTPNWGSARWDYAMTFFEDVSERHAEMMSFYDRPALAEVIDDAAREAGVEPVEITYTDRSVLVGRHTATRSFNPSIPPYRTLVNDLARGSVDVSPEDLLFTPPEEGAPRPVLDFFRTWGKEWNDLVRESVSAAELLEHERKAARQGLGVGHSLTATVVVSGNGRSNDR